jgi:N-formylglutamate amidohydrolase
MIFHLPHASMVIPAAVRKQFVLDDGQLAQELIRLTDTYTDELFELEGALRVRAGVSRLVVDVERFADDTEEPMAALGMGAVYTRTSEGKRLRRPPKPTQRQALMAAWYEPHHQELSTAVEKERNRKGNALIVDCHSFPSRPLPCDAEKSERRPQFCIGTDPYHTPTAMALAAADQLRYFGYSVDFDRPYQGALVPREFYRRDPMVHSIMIEVNRALYMDERTGRRLDRFDRVKRDISSLLRTLTDLDFAFPGARDVGHGNGGRPKKRPSSALLLCELCLGEDRFGDDILRRFYLARNRRKRTVSLWLCCHYEASPGLWKWQTGLEEHTVVEDANQWLEVGRFLLLRHLERNGEFEQWGKTSTWQAHPTVAELLP